jgi:ribose/xylose/arabinose/galactoside ABC-type transport system permease subunit
MQGSSVIWRGSERDAIAAVVVRGASVFGEAGDALSSASGVFVLATIENIIDLAGTSSEPPSLAKRDVIIAAGGSVRISAAIARGRRRRDNVAAQPGNIDAA